MSAGSTGQGGRDGGTPAPRTRAFWWEGPGGGRLAVWNGWHYVAGHSAFGLGDLERLTARLARSGHMAGSSFVRLDDGARSILFSGDIGARQMGQVLRYGRQCADDMLNAIADLLYSQSAGDAGPVSQPAQTPAAAPAPAGKPAPAPEPLPTLHDEKLDAAARELNQQDLDAFWTDAATQVEAVESSGNALSFEQARKLGLVDNPSKE